MRRLERVALSLSLMSFMLILSEHLFSGRGQGGFAGIGDEKGLPRFCGRGVNIAAL